MFNLSDHISKPDLEAFRRKHHITRMSLFGSALHGNPRTVSDIDLLVEFDPEHTPGLLDLAGMEMDLTKIIGKKVDPRTPAELSRYFRKQVMETAMVEYAG